MNSAVRWECFGMQHFSSTLTKFNMKDEEHKVEKEQKSLNELKKINIIVKIIQTSPCSTEEMQY